MGITQQIGASSIIKPGVIDSAAARPASPYEGQVIFQKDTDQLLVWNGTAWVCLTPKSATVTTYQTTTSTTYTDLSTSGPAVTIDTGTSALITFSAAINAPSGQNAHMSFAVSGATTLAASDDNCTFAGGVTGGLAGSLSRTMLVTGLTAGSNTFTVKYSCPSGLTAGFRNRGITVVGIP